MGAVTQTVTTEKKIKRSEFATFINVTPGGAATYVRFGKGVTSQTIAYNPKIESEQYIHEDNATSSLEGYAPTINTPQKAYKGNKAFDFVDKLRRSRAVGVDAETDILLVYLYDKDSEDNYAAEQQKVSISIAEFGGEAGNPLSITFDLGFIGDPKAGKVKITGDTIAFS